MPDPETEGSTPPASNEAAAQTQSDKKLSHSSIVLFVLASLPIAGGGIAAAVFLWRRKGGRL